MGLFFEGDKKRCIGFYKGLKIYQVGQMIGNNWYGKYYVTIPRGKSRREMKVKDSVCRSIGGIKKYIDENIDKLK